MIYLKFLLELKAVTLIFFFSMVMTLGAQPFTSDTTIPDTALHNYLIGIRDTVHSIDNFILKNKIQNENSPYANRDTLNTDDISTQLVYLDTTTLRSVDLRFKESFYYTSFNLHFTRYKLYFDATPNPLASDEAFSIYADIRRDLLVRLDNFIETHLLQNNFDLAIDSMYTLLNEPEPRTFVTTGISFLTSDAERSHSLRSGFFESFGSQRKVLAGVTFIVSTQGSEHHLGVGARLGYGTGGSQRMPKRLLLFLEPNYHFEGNQKWGLQFGAAYLPPFSNLGFSLALDIYRNQLGGGFVIRL